jgi:hypothetical protein
MGTEDLATPPSPPSPVGRADRFLQAVGCASILGLGALVFGWLGPLWFVFGGIGLLIALGLGAWGWSALRRRRAIENFRRAWQPRGKDLLLVHSNGPHWKQHIEDHWLPRWGARAVLLNWSERSTWEASRPEVGLFRECAGDREFNPLAIVVPARGHSVHVVRFWRAFRDHKHGRTHSLRAAEAELEARLKDASGEEGG